jgi:hypothetical protein
LSGSVLLPESYLCSVPTMLFTGRQATGLGEDDELTMRTGPSQHSHCQGF